MTARFIRVAGFLAVSILAVVLGSGRGSQTQSTNSPATGPTNSTRDYKVELVHHKKDLEGRLKEDGRNGWRVQSVAADPSDNGLVVILEKYSSAP